MGILLLTLLAAGPDTHTHKETPARSDTTCSDPLSYQVLLDRLGFSVGEIDGTSGPNLHHVVAAFQTSAKLTPTGALDCETWNALAQAGATEILVDYTISDQDVQGPYLDRPVPSALATQAELPALSYASVAEAIAERFHASPRWLARINKGRRFAAGTVIRVPAVTPFDPSRKPTADSSAGAVSIEVSRSNSILRVTRADGSLALVAPVSSGSEHDPLPIGTWKVTGTSWMPPFHYNPELFWDAEPGASKAVIKPGPNNPVGVVWVDINVPHYGMHGTPAPGLVGHAQSHGCVRLTNWDAARLASLVKPGTPVVFVE
jgi:lipoprotein-anchoring transpeptidase ErfK/SrfK